MGINNKHLHLQQELYTLPRNTTSTQSFYFPTQTTQWISSRTLWEVTRTAPPSPAAVTRAQTMLTRPFPPLTTRLAQTSPAITRRRLPTLAVTPTRSRLATRSTPRSLTKENNNF